MNQSLCCDNSLMIKCDLTCGSGRLDPGETTDVDVQQDRD